MTARPGISILMPAYNAGPWIQQSIASVQAQSFSDWELIIVDDGSSDDTAAAARAVADTRIVVLSQENAGAAAARNRAFATSSGAYIQYLDADDLLAPNKLALQWEAAGNGRYALLSGAWSRFIDDPNVRLREPDSLWQDSAPVRWLQIALTEHRMMHPACWLTARALHERAGPWNERLSVNDDGEFFARVIAGVPSIKHVDAAESLYRSALPASLSGQVGRRSAQSQIDALNSIAKVLLAMDDSVGSQAAVATARARLAMALWAEVPDLCGGLIDADSERATTSLYAERSRLFQALAPALGWRAARRIEAFLTRIRGIRSGPSIPKRWRAQMQRV